MQPAVRKVISQEIRDKAEKAAMEAAFKANGSREVNYTVEYLIKEAVEGAINQLEFEL